MAWNWDFDTFDVAPSGVLIFEHTWPRVGPRTMAAAAQLDRAGISYSCRYNELALKPELVLTALESLRNWGLPIRISLRGGRPRVDLSALASEILTALGPDSGIEIDTYHWG